MSSQEESKIVSDNNKTSRNEILKPVSESIKEILEEKATKDPSIKFIAVVDNDGLVISAHPMKKDDIETIESIGGLISEVYRCTLEAFKGKTGDLAERVSMIVIGLDKYKIEFYKHAEYSIVIFKSL